VCIEGCANDTDCNAFETCDAGTCVTKGCTNKDSSCDLGQWCCGAERFADSSTCPSTMSAGQCFNAPDPWCRVCNSNDDCANIHELGLPSFCYEVDGPGPNGQSQSLGKFCSVGCHSNADCPRGLACQTDLPTDQSGVTTSGCLDVRCPAIAGARP
jgi:hypothetical protein